MNRRDIVDTVNVVWISCELGGNILTISVHGPAASDSELPLSHRSRGKTIKEDLPLFAKLTSTSTVLARPIAQCLFHDFYTIYINIDGVTRYT